MNRTDIEAAINELKRKQIDMRDDLKVSGHLLSASSSLAIIIRLVNLQREVEEYESMLDFIKFEELTKDF
jgi:hypothetical protein